MQFSKLIRVFIYEKSTFSHEIVLRENMFFSVKSTVTLAQCGKVHKNAITPKFFRQITFQKFMKFDLNKKMHTFLPLGGISVKN